MQRLILMSIIFTISCSSEPEFENPFDSLPPNQLTVTDLEGTIEFWDIDDFNKYYIRVFIQGTIDSVVIGFVDDLDDAFKQTLLRVLFSGTYERSDDNPRPRVGGQDIYSLILTSIKAV